MRKYKLLLADIDGTLTPDLGMPPREFIPSPRLVNAINKIVGKVHIGFCTGRDKDTVIKICSKLGLKSPQIIEGGAKIIDVSGKTLWVKYISTTSINEILKILKRTKTSFSVIVDGTEIVDEIPTANLDKITAVLWYDLPKNQTELLKQELSLCTDIAFMVNHDRTGNTIYITDKLETKAHGVRKLIEILNINKDEVIGVGDGNNDKALLLECGLKVAMGNAVAEIKEIADYIAPDVESDGVAHVIEKFVLPNL